MHSPLAVLLHKGASFCGAAAVNTQGLETIPGLALCLYLLPQYDCSAAKSPCQALPKNVDEEIFPTVAREREHRAH